MGVHKTVLKTGNGVDRPKSGDQITTEYTGNIYDSNQTQNGCRGKLFDSTALRNEDFTTQIGAGKVIKGWDEGILSADGGMTLGEKAILTITSDYAYGASGFPGLIPPHADLIFDVELKAINGKQA